MKRIAALGVAAGALVSMYVGAGTAAADPVPLELPFVCDGKTWTGNNSESNAHVGTEIDWNLKGQDDLGEPVLAAASGQIIDKEVLDPRDGVTQFYGNFLKIRHADGRMTYYAHLQSMSVNLNEWVQQGQQIGTLGNTDENNPGISPHLHFEYRASNGTHLEPSFGGQDFTFPEDKFVSKNCDYGAGDNSVSGVVDADGTASVFARQNDGDLMYKNLPSGSWTDLGGSLAAGPDAISRRAGTYDVVARGTNGQVHYKWKNGGSWSEWRTDFSPFKIAYAPAIVAVDSDTMIMFAVRESDHRLLKRRWDHGQWEAGWTGFGNGDPGGFTSGPDASVRPDGVVDVVIRGAGGRVNHFVRHTDSTWSAPVARGDLITAPGSAPSVVHNGGAVYVVARGPGGSPYRNALAQGEWTGWARIDVGDTLRHGPDLIGDTDGDARMQLFGRDSQGRIFRSIFTNEGGWADLVFI